MKTIATILISLLFISLNAFSQLRVDANGNVLIKNGTFAPGADAYLYLGDYGHYIKSTFGVGVSLGTAGSPEAIRILQYTNKIGLFKAPAYALDVNGYIRGYNLIPSDMRYKTDVSSLTNKIGLLSNIQGYTYRYNISTNKFESKNELNGNIHYGFMAQELQKVFPELVHEDSLGYLSVDYISFIPLLIEAFNDQSKQIADLKSQITSVVNVDIEKNHDSNSFIKQNKPNPFSTDTEIDYSIPQNCKSAYIYIYDLQGNQKRVISLTEKGTSKVIINGGDLSAGMYLYSLIVDSELIDTKKMVLTD